MPIAATEPVTVLSRDELIDHIRHEAERMVGQPADDVLAMLERGELAGTAAEDALRSLLVLLDER